MNRAAIKDELSGTILKRDRIEPLASEHTPSYNSSMHRLPSFAIAPLLMVAHRFMENEPSRVLGFEDVYLRRWWLGRDDGKGNVYLHQMMRSDRDPEFHDHEYEGGSMSILLDGKMREYMPDGMRTLVPGDVVVRGPLDRHRIEIDQPTISIFITGPRDPDRNWGFWDALGVFTPAKEMFSTRYGQD